MATSNKNILSFSSNGDGTCGLAEVKDRTITELMIPSVSPDGDRVVAIGAFALSECDALTSVILPESVTDIGYGAFTGCVSLTSIIIPNSVTEIESTAFCYCERLTSISIPKSVIEIGSAVFEGCHALSSIIVEEGNPIYHSGGNCLIQTASKKLISACKTSVIPNDGSVTEISANAFSDCVGLTEMAIPNGVKKIGANAFAGCVSLTSIELPDSVTKIDEHAFILCEKLTSVRLSERVTEIQEGAFGYCESLTSITIPKSVKEIGSWVFHGCESLTSVIYPGTKADWDAIQKADDWDEGADNFTLHCSDGDVVEHGTNAGVNEYVWNTSAGL